LLLALGLLAVSQIPHIWGLRVGWKGYYPEKVYSGFPYTYGDEATTYLGWIRQAREGHFFMIDRLTPEEHPRNYINLLFWVLGTTAAATGLSELAIYSIARVVIGAVLLGLLWLLATRMFRGPTERLVCYTLLLVSGGWEGVWGFFERNFNGPHASSPAWWTPQISTLFSLMAFPHLLASFVGMVVTILFLARAWSRGTLPVRQRDLAAAGAGLSMAALTMFHPFDAFTMAAVLWFSPLVFMVAESRMSLAAFRVSVIATIPWLPALLYNLFIFLTNPALEQWNLQNVMITPKFGRLVMMAGISGCLALITLLRIRSLGRPQLIMLAWAVVVPVLIYIPLQFQRRMLGGIQFPLAVLAASALVWLGPKLLGGWLRKEAAILIMAAVVMPLQVLTPYYLFDIEWSRMRLLQYPSWLLASESQILERLDQVADERDVVLASYELGNFIPWQTGARAFLGHYALTMHAREKAKLVERFFGGDPADDVWRREHVEKWGISYILDTPYERALGGLDPARLPWLIEILSTGHEASRCRVFKVNKRVSSAQATPRSPAS
jgi:hypothetical protein